MTENERKLCINSYPLVAAIQTIDNYFFRVNSVHNKFVEHLFRRWIVNRLLYLGDLHRSVVRKTDDSALRAFESRMCCLRRQLNKVRNLFESIEAPQI